MCWWIFLPLILCSYLLILLICGLVFMTWHNVTNKLAYNNSTNQSPSSETGNLSVSQEIPRFIWKPKIHYSVQRTWHWTLSWASCSQHKLTPYALNIILILSYHLFLDLQNCVFHSGSDRCYVSHETKYRQLSSLGFICWSLVFNIGFREWAATNVEDFPTFRKTLQFPSSQLTSLGRLFLFHMLIWQW
jgi:hypothetical protein